MRTASLYRILTVTFSLFISPVSHAAVMVGGETICCVADGDNLLLISAKLGVDMAMIRRENNFDRTRHLQTRP